MAIGEAGRMRLYRDYAAPPDLKGAVVAIGNFDGLHRGHRALIGETRRIARASGRPFAVVTFEPHPRSVFQPDLPPFRLTPLRSKLRLLASLGADATFCLRFNRSLSAKPADRFVADVLVDGLGVHHVVVGYDFAFGHRRSGNAEVLAALGERHGFAVTVMEPVTHDDDVCSSTIIRVNLETGRIRRAAALLGHWWELEGRVRGGHRRGRQLGFPTANLHLKPGALRPALGVYAVRMGWDRPDGGTVWHDAVANLGRRPTFDGTGVVLEVHLFDFAGDLYGRHVRVAFVEHLRAERRFPGLEALKAQIAADSAEARRLLALPENRTDAFAAVA